MGGQRRAVGTLRGPAGCHRHGWTSRPSL